MINNGFHFLALQMLGSNCRLQGVEEAMLIHISSPDSLDYMRKHFQLDYSSKPFVVPI